MRLKHREIQRQLAEVRNWLDGIERDLATIVYMANTNCDDGVSGVSYDGKSRSSGPANPVEAHVLGRVPKAKPGHPEPKGDPRDTDTVAIAARQFAASVNAAVRELRNAGKAGWSLLPLPVDQARALTEQDEVNDAGMIQGLCKNCRRPVARTAKDPLRSGRCNTCRAYFERVGIERPKALWEIQENAAEALALGEGLIVEGAA